jgi:branched-chain amino acid transport system permease protein
MRAMPKQDSTPVQRERLLERMTRFTRPSFFIQIGLLLALIMGPLVLSSFRVMDVIAKIMVFTVVVASYDLILGYTGIISFAHGMFFGLGAYSLALVIHHSGSPQWYHPFLALGVALPLSIVLALVIAFFSLRVKAIFFAMMTLALAEFAHILGIQWYDLTLAEDGVSFKLPGILSVDWSAGRFLAADVNGRLMTYYLILIVSVALFVGLLRFVRSPVGRVLKSIRENEQRSTALGFKTFKYQVFSTVFGSATASVAGILFAMWLRYVNPESVLGISTMLYILLMVIIGGLGTMYGSIIGAAFIKITETWLPDLQKLAVALFPNVDMIHRLAERWVLYFGILFILVVFFFPRGFVGKARDMITRRKMSSVEND